MTDNHELSPREQEILGLVAQGLTNREIAQVLSISPNTVKVHLSNIFEKAGVASRTEATLYGMEQGIVDVPGGGDEITEDWRLTLWPYRWLLIPLLLLLILLSVSLTGNVFVPAPSPQLQSAEEAMAARWQELAPLPEPIVGVAAVAYGGEILSIGGEGSEGVSDCVFSYNPEVDIWRRLSDKPTPVTDVNGVVIGEKIYIPGGRTADEQPTNILEIYDPRQDTWTRGSSLPIAVSSYGLADFEGKLYLFGGWDGYKDLRGVWIYDPEKDTWHQGTQMAQAKMSLDAVSLPDRIVVVGGTNEEGPVNNAENYYPSREGDTGSPWKPFFNLPKDGVYWKSAAISESLYIVGNQEDDPLIFFLLNGTSWDEVPININFYPQFVKPVPLNSYIYFLMMEQNQELHFWRYQAFYYEIFFPLAD